LDGLIIRVRQTLEVFNRATQNLVSSMLKGDRTSVKPPSFIDLAFSAVKDPLKIETMDFLLNQWGALGLQANLHSSLDGYGAIKVKKAQSISKPMSFDDVNDAEPVSRVGKVLFLDRYAKEISQSLTIGPLSLSEAINRGWFMLEDKVMIGDLVGVFIAPESLDMTIGRNQQIQVSLNSNINATDIASGRLFYSDLEMSIQENSK
jgi:hypothetical protein